MRHDVIVLGAGIVGVTAALHLQSRGRSVCLVDRRSPGEETSYGNAGLIERASVIPYAMPRQITALLRYSLNRSPEVRYHFSHLPRMGAWLFRYWWHSSPERLLAATNAMLPLIERCVTEHDQLIEQAGTAHLLRRSGWIETFRTVEGKRKALAAAKDLESYGLRYEVLDRVQLKRREPCLGDAPIGAVHWLDPTTVSDPGALTKGYAALFTQQGGRFVSGDAQTLSQSGRDWVVTTQEGPVRAGQAVVALGPWSDRIFKPLGYRIPLAIKRGYHMHYATTGGARLNQPVLDFEGGYVIAPMAKGIRLTTGVELAGFDAPEDSRQLDQAEALARNLFPLGERVEPKPWLGRRPCLPDMRPVIGPAPRHPGLWFCFGHAHHGLTLGPVSGRLLAEMMTGEAPFCDPLPYRADRF
ncbi:NAD(P)/FAD-dependent oxidoreductase [Microvirga makkahensis]|uniref:FAD-dependent oxidoreductase n=1 Tax=Microvirga makkahensis TaxID=1128670 RepID=A0A7X3SPZ3_9HYPH|nr:FAD-binding oxidoreductase [Microvirga makkahensis]MXQ12619.1 FAD-dependent oxidoreductase [Microvirga makkahensis]